MQQKHLQFLKEIYKYFETNIPAGGSFVLVMISSGSLQLCNSSFQTASLFILSKLLQQEEQLIMYMCMCQTYNYFSPMLRVGMLILILYLLCYLLKVCYTALWHIVAIHSIYISQYEMNKFTLNPRNSQKGDENIVMYSMPD
jgi:uncharacterized membrane protein